MYKEQSSMKVFFNLFKIMKFIFELDMNIWWYIML
jgi:hypothetical protein